MRHHPPRSIRSAAPIAIGLAFLLLSGCKPREEVVNARSDDPLAETMNHTTPIELPPALKASATYRCKDNSLVFIDYMTDDITAQIRTKKSDVPVKLKAAEKGDTSFVSADGDTKVDGTGKVVNVTLPGKGAQSCKS